MLGSAATRTPFSSEFGPFMPGTGGLPPYMAGRQQEQTKVEEYLDFLMQGMAPPSPLIFYGPRGNGKTALLHWTRRRALHRGIKVINFSTAEVRTEESLINQLSHDTWWTGLFEVVFRRGGESR